ncbi:tRNA lysidine(34) synthetase TilS [bacterium]|nr:tRNA lysidine(34) synthetase TilS [bacterium]
MPNLLDQARIYINKYGLLEKGDGIIVACSGGPDSIALFYILLELVQEYDLRLCLAHLNHGIRKESDEDGAFVRRVSESKGIHFFIEKTDCLSLSKEWKLSLEASARKARYDFFARCAKMTGFSNVALGHTANDQAETVLMRLIRGSGLRGLTGIPPVRESNGIRFIRPILGCERPDIIKYLSLRKIQYRTDETNLKRCCTRNRVRLDIIPYIERDFNPSIIRTISRTAELLRDDLLTLEGLASRQILMPYKNDANDENKQQGLFSRKTLMPLCVATKHENRRLFYEHITTHAAGWKGFLHYRLGRSNGLEPLNLDDFKDLPIGMQRRILQGYLEQFYGEDAAKGIYFIHIDAIMRLINRTEGGGELSLPSGIILYRQERKLFLISREFDSCSKADDVNTEGEITNVYEPGESFFYPIRIPGITHIPVIDLTLDASILYINKIKEMPSDPMTAFLDYETIEGPVQIRTRIHGDRFHPLGMSGEKKLKEFFIDAKVIRGIRDIWPLFANGSHIIWVLGIRIGHPYRITSKTSKVLRVVIK